MLYGARECARLLVEKGIDAAVERCRARSSAVERHRLHGSAVDAALQFSG